MSIELAETKRTRKVAILTFQRALNYGAALQAYALQRVVKNLGHECELIDLDRPTRKEVRKWSITVLRNKLTSHNQSISRGVIECCIRKLQRLTDKAIEPALQSAFRAFENHYIRFSDHQYQSLNSLKHTKLDYSAYITGSDQVWNPNFPWDPEPYFLTFAQPGALRISYAASFGVTEIGDPYKPFYAKWLREFNAISVREDVGSSIVAELVERRATVVLDPTLLIDGGIWARLCSPTTEKKRYLFCYNLANNRATDDAACRFGRLLGLRVVRVGSSICKPRAGIVQRLCVGPLEFVSLIQNASFVVTNSFHGTALAINLGRPFFSVITPDSSISDRNSRLESLLRMTHLCERSYERDKNYTIDDCLRVNYIQAHEHLSKMRVSSLKFLEDALS